jgi:hypothetical protein
MSNTHTPTPWVMVPDQESHGCQLALCNAGGMTIARSPESPHFMHAEQAIDDANFTHIVKCVNAHDELVAALQRIVREFDCGRTPLACDISMARAALAKVQS